MGSSPPSSTFRPDDIRAHRFLEDGGTRKVGSGRVIEAGTSRYALIPHLIAEMLDVEVGQDVEIYTNLEHGLVIHRIPEADENGPE